jgi:hypothetical protein
LESQQPLQFEEPQAAPLHWLDWQEPGAQLWQLAPPEPQAVLRVPFSQVPEESQQPLQFAGVHEPLPELQEGTTPMTSPSPKPATKHRMIFMS